MMLLGLQVLEEDKMISQEMLWTQYFTESYLGFKPNSLIDQIAKAIIYRPDLFRTLVLNLSQSDMSYEYNPTIGASIDFRFNKGEGYYNIVLEKLSFFPHLSLCVCLN